MCYPAEKRRAREKLSDVSRTLEDRLKMTRGESTTMQRNLMLVWGDGAGTNIFTSPEDLESCA